MANEYLVNSEDMTSVADAIREKGGTSDALAFPDGFVDAVGAIQAGGVDESMNDALLENTAVDYYNPRLTTLRSMAFRNATKLQTVNIPNAVTVNANDVFTGCTALKEIKMEKLETAGTLCYNLDNLEKVYIPKVTEFLGAFCFSGCSKAVFVLNFEEMTNVGKGTFRNCKLLSGTVYLKNHSGGILTETFTGTGIEKLILGTSVTHFDYYIINNNTALTAIVIKRSDKLVTLNGVQALVGSTIEAGTGYVYVHKTLDDGSDGVSAYQVATNWTTYADQIRAIEDYPGIDEV